MANKSPSRSVSSRRSYVSKNENSKGKARYSRVRDSATTGDAGSETRSVLSYQSNNRSVASEDAENRSDASDGSVDRSSYVHRDSRSIVSGHSKGRSVVSHKSRSRSVVSHQNDGQESTTSFQSKSGSAFSALSKTLAQSSDDEPKRQNIEDLDLSALISCLKSAVLSLEEIERLDLLQEMIFWKKKVNQLANENGSLVNQITSLERERATLQYRLRRLEKRVQEHHPMTILEKHEFGTFDDKVDEFSDNDNDDETVSTVGPSKELKTLLGKSFRQKWNRRKLAGLDSDDSMLISEEESLGSSTIAARKFVNEFLEDQKREENLRKSREETAKQVSSSTDVEDVALPPVPPREPDILSI